MLAALKRGIADHYGGKRAILKYVGYQAHLYLTRQHRNQRTDLNCIRRLVFVCEGNICRSPYAAALAQDSGFPAVSFGLNAAAGATANPVAQQIAEERGISLAGHRSAPISKYTPMSGDFVLGFEPVQKHALERILSQQKEVGLSLIGLWRDPPTAYLHDPYGLSPRYFRICFQRIDDAVATIVRRLQVRNAKSS